MSCACAAALKPVPRKNATNAVVAFRAMLASLAHGCIVARQHFERMPVAATMRSKLYPLRTSGQQEGRLPLFWRAKGCREAVRRNATKRQRRTSPFAALSGRHPERCGHGLI